MDERMATALQDIDQREEVDSPDQDQAAADRQSKMLEIATRLQTMCDGRVTRRASLEKRWLDEVMQYNGKYSLDVETNLKGSKAFYSGTRKLCNFIEARLGEMILPTDDRNWSISPSPIPDMPEDMGGTVEAITEESEVRALKMQSLMDDQLAECGYNRVMRGVIHDGVVLGTGVVKGPVVRVKQSRRYSQQDIGAGVMEYGIQVTESLTAGIERVSPWNFYPDDDAPTIDVAENVFERHPLTAKQLRQLSKTPGFDSEVIREVLMCKPGSRADQAQPFTQINQSAGGTTDSRYYVWEFNGSLPYDEARTLTSCDDGEYDPLDVVQMTVWFCDGKVLKAVCKADQNEPLPYSVWCWEEDDNSIYGYGAPHRVEHSQRLTNSALRMVYDNAAFTVLPQLIIDKTRIEPVNGSWDVTPGKAWYSKGGGAGDAFKQEAIASNLPALENLLQFGMKLMEEEAGVQMLAQSGQAPQVTQTATGTAMLMNSATSPLRRAVRTWDDRITRPTLERQYRWNMDYHDDDSVKGDYDVIPLGSSSLLVREMDRNGLAEILKLALADPELRNMTSVQDLYRKVVQSMQVSAEGVIKSEEVLKAEEEARKGQPQMPDPKMLDVQVKMEKVKNDRAALQLKGAELSQRAQAVQAGQQLEGLKIQQAAQDSQNDLQRTVLSAQTDDRKTQSQQMMMLAKLAAAADQSVQQIKAKLGIARMEIDQKNQLFNAEQALKMRTGSGI
jgi:hypothetical protein